MFQSGVGQPSKGFILAQSALQPQQKLRSRAYVAGPWA
jgi:hypothetical protein